jgi:hypothetical protein
MSQVQPWSVDPTVHVDRIHVIESLPPDQQSWYYRTGARLFGELQDACARMPVEPHLHVVRTRDDLCALLRGVIGEAESGHSPLLHFETHGVERAPGKTTTSIGMSLASGEVMPWCDLAPYLVAINEGTRLNLIVFVSTCYGLDIATLFQPLEPAPVRIVIGPMRPIDVPEIDRTTRAFYHSLLRDRNGVAAATAMNATVEPNRMPFLVLTAEWMFMQILLGYFNNATNETEVAARAERVVVDMIVRGVPPAVAALQCEPLRAFLRDRKHLFDSTYRRYFFVEKHPEIADRFRMTYESCFQEAPRADDRPSEDSSSAAT